MKTSSEEIELIEALRLWKRDRFCDLTFGVKSRASSLTNYRLCRIRQQSKELSIRDSKLTGFFLHIEDLFRYLLSHFVAERNSIERDNPLPQKSNKKCDDSEQGLICTRSGYGKGKGERIESREL